MEKKQLLQIYSREYETLGEFIKPGQFNFSPIREGRRRQYMDASFRELVFCKRFSTDGGIDPTKAVTGS